MDHSERAPLPGPMPQSEPAPVALALSQGYALITGYVDRHQVLRLEAPDGRLCLQITLTEAGPRLELQSTSLRIQTDGDLELCGRQLHLRAEDTLSLQAGAGLSVKTEGPLSLQSQEQLELRAPTQRLEATRGNLEILASDDVAVDGERIRLNSPQTAGDYALPQASAPVVRAQAESQRPDAPRQEDR